MAENWMQLNTNLEDEHEFIRMMELTGEPEDVVFARVVRFWCWVHKSTKSDVLPFTLDGLARKFGGSPEFWKAMADDEVQWLCLDDNRVTVPGYEKRFSQGAKRRQEKARSAAGKRQPEKSTSSRHGVDMKSTSSGHDVHKMPVLERESESESEKDSDISHQSSDSGDASGGEKTWSRAAVDVPLEQIEEVAAELFRQARYTQNDGRIFWEAAAVGEAFPGSLDRARLNDAAMVSKGKGSPPAYFRKVVRQMCPEFEKLKQQVWIDPKWPDRPPDQISRSARELLVLRSVPAGDDGGGNRAQVEAALNALK